MSTMRPSDRRGEPPVAVLLTWFLPGAGDLYLGRVVPAIVGFLLVEGLYALGWWLSDGRVFELLDPELRGPLATLLTPEVGNLGAMIAQLRVVGYGGADPSPFPPHLLLGGMLTGLSGIANLFLMANVHLAARTPKTASRAGMPPALLAFFAWLVPGLGHFLQGRRRRALIVFTLLVGCFAVGTFLAAGTNLSRERHFYYWSGQMMLGLPAIAAELLSGRPPLTRDLSFGDIALLYACLPGLLNILCILDVFGVAEKRWLAPAPAPPAPEAPVPDDPAPAEGATS